jgi:transcriptional regulator with XRE-family HTH domain
MRLFVYLDNILSIMGKYSIHKLPSDILKSTAMNVSLLRKEMSLTQHDLAEKSGVSYGSIKRFERFGKISFESLLKIAEALNRLDEFETLFVPSGSKELEKLFDSL